MPAIFAKCASLFNAYLYTLNNKQCRNYFHKKYSIILGDDRTRSNEKNNWVCNSSLENQEFKIVSL